MGDVTAFAATGTQRPAVELHGVAKLYGRTVALRATNMRIEQGETVALLGPNGSGKTTLLKILAGVISPTLGEGTILGRDLRQGRRDLQGVVGLLASESYTYDDLTVRENLDFASVMAGRSNTRVDAVLALVDLERHDTVRSRDLSSGMKRRLSIGRLLLLPPELMLLDEPYTNLDAEGSLLVDSQIRDAHVRNCTTLLATHDAGRALELADRVAVLERGRLCYFGSTQAYRAHAHVD